MFPYKFVTMIDALYTFVPKIAHNFLHMKHRLMKNKIAPVLSSHEHHEDTLGTVYINPRILDVGTSWR
jgi:hypothetical protein